MKNSIIKKLGALCLTTALSYGISSSFSSPVAAKGDGTVVFVGNPETEKSKVIAKIFETCGQESNDMSNIPTLTLNAYDTIVNIKVIDTAGHVKFRSLTQSNVRSADVVVVAVDMSDKNGLSSLGEWIDFIKENAPEEAQVIVIGTNSEEAAFSLDAMQNAVNSLSFDRIKRVICVSDKTHEGINELITDAAKLIHAIPEDNEEKKAPSVCLLV